MIEPSGSISGCVIEEPIAVLAEYGGMPIAFTVSEVFDVVDEGDGGARLEARRVSSPYVKDYDAVGDPPMRWAERFDLSNWGFLSAFSGDWKVVYLLA